MSVTVDKIKIAGHEVEYVLRKKFTTRNLSLRLDMARCLHISAPRLMSTARILEFLSEKEAWLKKNIEKIDGMNREKETYENAIEQGETFKLLGQNYVLDIRFISKKRPRAFFECLDGGENSLALEINENTGFLDIPDVGRSAIEKLYKEFAKEYFTKRTDEINRGHFGFRYRSIRIKNQSTRFGSCSSRGNLNFNWKAIMAPKEVIDYLLVHELAHLKEMNHSEKFWSTVEKACPDYKRHRKWLKSSGHTLLW